MAYEPARREQAAPPASPKPQGTASRGAADAAAALKRFASKAGQGPLRVAHLFAADGCARRRVQQAQQAHTVQRGACQRAQPRPAWRAVARADTPPLAPASPARR